MMDEKDKTKILDEFEHYLPGIVRLIRDDLDKKGVRFSCESETMNVVVPSINEKP